MQTQERYLVWFPATHTFACPEVLSPIGGKHYLLATEGHVPDGSRAVKGPRRRLVSRRQLFFSEHPGGSSSDDDDPAASVAAFASFYSRVDSITAVPPVNASGEASAPVGVSMRDRWCHRDSIIALLSTALGRHVASSSDGEDEEWEAPSDVVRSWADVVVEAFDASDAATKHQKGSAAPSKAKLRALTWRRLAELIAESPASTDDEATVIAAALLDLCFAGFTSHPNEESTHDATDATSVKNGASVSEAPRPGALEMMGSTLDRMAFHFAGSADSAVMVHARTGLFVFVDECARGAPYFTRSARNASAFSVLPAASPPQPTEEGNREGLDDDAVLQQGLAGDGVVESAVPQRKRQRSSEEPAKAGGEVERVETALAAAGDLVAAILALPRYVITVAPTGSDDDGDVDSNDEDASTQELPALTLEQRGGNVLVFAPAPDPSDTAPLATLTGRSLGSLGSLGSGSFSTETAGMSRKKRKELRRANEDDAVARALGPSNGTTKARPMPAGDVNGDDVLSRITAQDLTSASRVHSLPLQSVKATTTGWRGKAEAVLIPVRLAEKLCTLTADVATAALNRAWDRHHPTPSPAPTSKSRDVQDAPKTTKGRKCENVARTSKDDQPATTHNHWREEVESVVVKREVQWDDDAVVVTEVACPETADMKTKRRREEKKAAKAAKISDSSASVPNGTSAGVKTESVDDKKSTVSAKGRPSKKKRDVAAVIDYESQFEVAPSDLTTAGGTVAPPCPQKPLDQYFGCCVCAARFVYQSSNVTSVRTSVPTAISSWCPSRCSPLTTHGSSGFSKLSKQTQLMFAGRAERAAAKLRVAAKSALVLAALRGHSSPSTVAITEATPAADDGQADNVQGLATQEEDEKQGSWFGSAFGGLSSSSLSPTVSSFLPEFSRNPPPVVAAPSAATAPQASSVGPSTSSSGSLPTSPPSLLSPSSPISTSSVPGLPPSTALASVMTIGRPGQLTSFCVIYNTLPFLPTAESEERAARTKSQWLVALRNSIVADQRSSKAGAEKDDHDADMDGLVSTSTDAQFRSSQRQVRLIVDAESNDAFEFAARHCHGPGMAGAGRKERSSSAPLTQSLDNSQTQTQSLSQSQDDLDQARSSDLSISQDVDASGAAVPASQEDALLTIEPGNAALLHYLYLHPEIAQDAAAVADLQRRELTLWPQHEAYYYGIGAAFKVPPSEWATLVGGEGARGVKSTDSTAPGKGNEMMETHVPRGPPLTFPFTAIDLHPCVQLPGQFEVVARYPLSPGLSIPYAGPFVDPDLEDTTIMERGDKRCFRGGNVARFVNLFSGFARRGNVGFRTVRFQQTIPLQKEEEKKPKPTRRRKDKTKADQDTSAATLDSESNGEVVSMDTTAALQSIMAAKNKHRTRAQTHCTKGAVANCTNIMEVTQFVVTRPIAPGERLLCECYGTHYDRYLHRVAMVKGRFESPAVLVAHWQIDTARRCPIYARRMAQASVRAPVKSRRGPKPKSKKAATKQSSESSKRPLAGVVHQLYRPMDLESIEASDVVMIRNDAVSRSVTSPAVRAANVQRKHAEALRHSLGAGTLPESSDTHDASTPPPANDAEAECGVSLFAVKHVDELPTAYFRREEAIDDLAPAVDEYDRVIAELHSRGSSRLQNGGSDDVPPAATRDANADALCAALKEESVEVLEKRVEELSADVERYYALTDENNALLLDRTLWLIPLMEVDAELAETVLGPAHYNDPPTKKQQLEGKAPLRRFLEMPDAASAISAADPNAKPRRKKSTYDVSKLTPCAADAALDASGTVRQDPLPGITKEMLDLVTRPVPPPKKRDASNSADAGAASREPSPRLSQSDSSGDVSASTQPVQRGGTLTAVDVAATSNEQDVEGTRPAAEATPKANAPVDGEVLDARLRAAWYPIAEGVPHDTLATDPRVVCVAAGDAILIAPQWEHNTLRVNFPASELQPQLAAFLDGRPCQRADQPRKRGQAKVPLPGDPRQWAQVRERHAAVGANDVFMDQSSIGLIVQDAALML